MRTSARTHARPWLLLAALVVAAPLPACGDKQLQALETPAAGVQLKYALEAGRGYTGHVRRSETVQSDFGSINRSLEADIDLSVLGEDPKRGDILVAARISNLRLQWTLPPSAPFSLDEFLAKAVETVQGMEIRFNVLPSGKVNYMPTPPQEGVEDEVKLVIEEVLETLESAFLEVPNKTVKNQESWTETIARGRKGKLGSFREGTIKTTFAGLFRDSKRAQDVAKLVIEEDRTEIITTKAGSHKNEWHGQTTALFSVSGNYLASISGEVRKFDPKAGTTFTKVQVDWNERQGPAPVAATPTTPAPEAGEVQSITDPCHPDYVGPESCEAGEVQAVTDPCDPDYVGAEACASDSSDAANPDATSPSAASATSTPPAGTTQGTETQSPKTPSPSKTQQSPKTP